eukprot:32102-Eustigmatos_ZCMA.PRE.1
MSDSWTPFGEGLQYELMNRNARRPKKANHGKRPCSSVLRRWRRKTFGRKGGYKSDIGAHAPSRS